MFFSRRQLKSKVGVLAWGICQQNKMLKLFFNLGNWKGEIVQVENVTRSREAGHG